MEHLLPLKVEFLLMFGVALLWTIVYILVIYKGFKDQACGMPPASICANITWEFLFTFIMPFHPLQQIVTLVWFLLDCIILLQFLFYSKSLYPRRTLLASVFSLLVIALLLHYGMSLEFHDKYGIYSAFGINLLMSILFIKMLLTKELRGQSLSIAYYKMVGTLCASILCYSLYPHSILLMIMYILIFILDVVYIVLVYDKSIKTVHKSTNYKKQPSITYWINK
ncbi:putative neutral ceramidase superfamily lipid hydrolase [Paenibacillus castaneae]|uniref:transmembrane-type terpene cyclase n=1 Tax=Paenibacillus castaneae TaxID=474957 RepID=UPI000C9B61B8|nr:hypothetical protein [Paenibacillus castaneae]NIK77109.1 putative neutral ceramidase superfamily lipid hydrolase [Paenibacillus castaneae]